MVSCKTIEKFDGKHVTVFYGDEESVTGVLSEIDFGHEAIIIEYQDGFQRINLVDIQGLQLHKE